MDELMRFLLSDPLITVGERGLAGIRSITGPEEVAGVDVALRTRGDQAELRGVAEGLAGAVSMMAGAELVVDDVEGGVAVATAESALEAGSPLTSSETYRTVVPFDAPASIAYVDLDKVQSVVEEFAAGEESVVKNLEPLRAFAVSNAGNEFSMRLSFDG
jgi:hypothetical protein